MFSVAENIEKIKNTIPSGVELVAVSKFHPAEMIEEAYAAGQRVFGESRAQELSSKVTALPSDIEWHFIGHLQTNKVRHIVPCVKLIQSIDSDRLLEVVNKEAERIGRTVDVLLQLHVAKETAKFGMTCDECEALVESGKLDSLRNVRVCGVMGMATNTDDENEIRKEFKAIRNVFDTLKKGVMADKPFFSEVSMGMSEDYRIAVEEGSTMIRVGSSIFGERQY